MKFLRDVGTFITLNCLDFRRFSVAESRLNLRLGVSDGGEGSPYEVEFRAWFSGVGCES